MIASRLDGLLARGRVTGYTVEEDAAYLEPRLPTLTYRMYAEGAASNLNLGAFASSIADVAGAMRLSRVTGAVWHRGGVWRTRQLCLAAEFSSPAGLAQAVRLVHCRFIAAPAAAPGSWCYPDVRVTGAEPLGTEPAYAHRWRRQGSAVVLLTLDPSPPLPGAETSRVRVLPSWIDYLAQATGSLACSTG